MGVWVCVCVRGGGMQQNGRVTVAFWRPHSSKLPLLLLPRTAAAGRQGLLHPHTGPVGALPERNAPCFSRRTHEETARENGMKRFF